MCSCNSNAARKLKIVGSLVWHPKEHRQHPRPSRYRACYDSIWGCSPVNLLFVATGLVALAAMLNVDATPPWAVFAWFMCGVSAALTITQLYGLSYYNQTLMWLGAETKPLPGSVATSIR